MIKVFGSSPPSSVSPVSNVLSGYELFYPSRILVGAHVITSLISEHVPETNVAL